MDLERDLFSVTTDGKQPTDDEMVDAVEALNFGATVLTPEQVPSRATAAPTGPVPDLIQTALDRARDEEKLVLLDFYADWCGPCKKMLKETWVEPRVVAKLEGFVFVKVDTDAHPEVSKWFRVSGLPDARVLSADGKELARLVGFKTADEVLVALEAANR